MKTFILKNYSEKAKFDVKVLLFSLILFLPDYYTIPKVQDDYSALFWWDFKDSYIFGTRDANDKNKEQYDHTSHWAKTHNPLPLGDFLLPYLLKKK